jgi:uncharacterized protein (DUF779 family)
MAARVALTDAAAALLGRLDPGDGTAVPFYMSKSQFEYWQHTHLTVDVVPGRGSGFSVEAPEGVRFIIRSRLLTAHELDELIRQPALRWRPSADADTRLRRA